MFPAQIPGVEPKSFSRCEERRQIKDRGKSLDSTQKADAAIKDAIYRSLWKDSVLRAIEYYEIDVHVKNGVAHLSGHIVGATSQIRIMNAIRTIPGVMSIRNELVLDDKLTLEVASSLSQIEHTYDCKFFTGASHGVISLNGNVRDEDVKLLTEKCAADNPGVRGVINNIRVAGVEQVMQSQPFLQPAIGAAIYFLDGISGVIKQVIINPDNRLVTQLTIQGQLSSHKQNTNAQPADPNPTLELTVVIPMNLIRYMTTSSGFLTIRSTETTQYQDFNRSYFASPLLDWTPPHPYCSEDVLFNVDVGEIENQIMVDPDIVQLNISAQPTPPQKAVIPVDVLASWEDDGGQIIQTAEVVS